VTSTDASSDPRAECQIEIAQRSAEEGRHRIGEAERAETAERN
jgi:hypothetical protein